MKKILIVEDDATIALGLQFSLQQEGYDAMVLNTVRQANEYLNNANIDLAILDVSLPDGTGYDLCRRIKSESNSPVIFLSAADDEVNIVMGLQLGADDYVLKPFRLKELLLRVKNVINRNQPKEESIIHIEDILIDTKAARVTKAGKEVFLSALEYRLLMILATHRGQMLDRNQLLESIWDIGGSFVNDNTLTVYIKRLREKIEDDPSLPKVIFTVRGLGYKIL
ncbi:MAG: DNA-binding response regulator [Firmicutes bacterium HGW-Firmicutes-19]|nr:MAG: DNA-binding response regulator [Firmicutes bacterium HGW-Firmicutes-19]